MTSNTVHNRHEDEQSNLGSEVIVIDYINDRLSMLLGVAARVCSYLVFCCGLDAFAQPSVIFSSIAWLGLTQAERDVIQSQYIVQAISPESFGMILDAQGVDRSTPGNTAGSNFGQALGSATYIDRSISSGNYSARNHLGAMVIGSLLGSGLDSRRIEKYHFRYAIRLGSGSVVYQDVISESPFRHPAGVCVLIPQLTLATDQGLCTQTAGILRISYLGVAAPKANPPDRPTQIKSADDGTRPAGSIVLGQDEKISDSDEETVVNCRSGFLAPVRTTRSKCQLINGVIQ